MTPDDPAALLRSQRSLRGLESAEEGSPIDALPAGVYGFTYSPSFDATPLFAAKRFRTFEFHKLTGGAVELVGYLTAAEAERVKSGAGDFEVHLYPDAWNDANHLASLPLARLVRSTQRPARDNGSAYTLRVE